MRGAAKKARRCDGLSKDHALAAPAQPNAPVFGALNPRTSKARI